MNNRLAMLPLAVALFAASPLAAQGTNPVVLAPGEVLAQVGGAGQVRSQPDIARFQLTVRAAAKDSAAARLARDAAVRDLTAKVQQVGGPGATVTVLPFNKAQIGFVGNEAYDGEAAVLNMPPQRKWAVTDVRIDLADMKRLPALRQLLSERDNLTVQPATLSLQDDTAARRAAISQAIQKGKEEADAYAAALGLRVSRVVRVFDPDSTTEQTMLTQALIMMNSRTESGTADEVVTNARVELEVVLAPR